MSSFFSFSNYKESFLNDRLSKQYNRRKPIWIHDVFLSFRGIDTRSSFTSHLYASLVNSGIKVFMDDESLQRGDRISTSLLRAIEQSQIAVVVFSRNYADSRWCLDELVKIMECYNTIGQVVLPVFYNVDPSEVRHQTGECGKAFQNLLTRLSKRQVLHNLLVKVRISREQSPITSWREALREAAGLGGFVVLNFR
jgi:hypothetical protein